MTRVVVPSLPRQRPLWRGVNELYGPTGDPLTGFYDRSPNFHVRDMASIEARRGYERAFDEIYHGHAAAAAIRDYSNISYLVVDGEGVKILSSLPQTYFEGFGPDHPGFINDDFGRANNADIQDGTTLPWAEGVDSEAVAGRTALDNLEVHQGILKLRNPGSGVTTASFADWGIEATTPWHVVRVEIDATGLGFTGNNQEWGITVFQGIPDLVIDQNGTINKPRIWAVDAHQTTQSDPQPDVCWGGVAARFQIKRTDHAGLKNEVRLVLYEFGSSEPPGSLLDRSGKVIYKWSENRTGVTTASSEVSWVLELGRRKFENGWKTRVDLYRDKTIGELDAGDITGQYATHLTEKRVVGDGTNGSFYVLPKAGGFSGLRINATTAPVTGYLGASEIKTGLDFSEYLF